MQEGPEFLCAPCFALRDDRKHRRGYLPDPAHPTGQALCIKGKVAPELVYHPDHLTHPIKRANPKGDADPGWKQIGSDEALCVITERLEELAKRHGPESVVFTSASPSTSKDTLLLDVSLRGLRVEVTD